MRVTREKETNNERNRIHMKKTLVLLTLLSKWLKYIKSNSLKKNMSPKW